MKKRVITGIVIVIVVLVATAAGLLFLLQRNPVAIVRVLDSAGKPIAGAVLRPEGMRTKSGPYQSGWFGWRADRNSVTNLPVTTDGDGLARIPYPKYVFERIETGVLCLGADHPDFAPARPECTVDTSPPNGAPPQQVLAYWLNRIRNGAITETKPIVLNKGAVLRIRLRPGAEGPSNVLLFANAADLDAKDTNTWFRPNANELVTRRLPSGPFTLRAFRIESNDRVWFSEVVSNSTAAGGTNVFELALKPGVAVRGQLVDLPKPVTKGRVIAHVWPSGFSPQKSPPQWHAWSEVKADGTFEFKSLPEGDLEVVALCDGFVSTNGPGQFSMRYPQKHVIGTNELFISIGMEPTARLEVTVLDNEGKPLPNAHVSTWPNVRYGEWSARILAGDCYNSVDLITAGPMSFNPSVPDFEGTSDSNGVAVLANLPATVKEFTVQHERFALPAVQLGGWSRKERQATLSLFAGQTNYTSVQLEPLGSSPVTHY